MRQLGLRPTVQYGFKVASLNSLAAPSSGTSATDSDVTLSDDYDEEDQEVEALSSGTNSPDRNATIVLHLPDSSSPSKTTPNRPAITKSNTASSSQYSLLSPSTPHIEGPRSHSVPPAMLGATRSPSAGLGIQNAADAAGSKEDPKLGRLYAHTSPGQRGMIPPWTPARSKSHSNLSGAFNGSQSHLQRTHSHHDISEEANNGHGTMRGGNRMARAHSRDSNDILAATGLNVHKKDEGELPLNSLSKSKEVAVAGGVALTEESVEMQVPDVITASLVEFSLRMGS